MNRSALTACEGSAARLGSTAPISTAEIAIPNPNAIRSPESTLLRGSQLFCVTTVRARWSEAQAAGRVQWSTSASAGPLLSSDLAVVRPIGCWQRPPIALPISFCACNSGLPDLQLVAYRPGNFALRLVGVICAIRADGRNYCFQSNEREWTPVASKEYRQCYVRS